MYKGLIDNAADQIGQLFTGFTEEDGLPAVFHCHGGKDRTGVVAALVLEALGVDRASVLDDYELTARYRLRSQQNSTYAHRAGRYEHGGCGGPSGQAAPLRVPALGATE